MNFYVGIINEVIDYIEGSIGERLQLADVSRRFSISDFHFNRIFSTVTGVTLKQYILGRKLTKALELLESTQCSVLDIALDLGFEYPEVFSRAFKKQFGVSPAQYRENPLQAQGIPKASVVRRDIASFQGGLALKSSNLYLEEFSLRGIFAEANVHREDFQDALSSVNAQFLLESSKNQSLQQDAFYTVVNCHGEDTGEYTVFCGRKPEPAARELCYQERIIPGGWYVCFQYQGDMFDIRETFSDDLYRWIVVKEAKLEANGIGMLNIYERDYPQTGMVKILVPVKKPV